MIDTGRRFCWIMFGYPLMRCDVLLFFQTALLFVRQDKKKYPHGRPRSVPEICRRRKTDCAAFLSSLLHDVAYFRDTIETD